MNNTLTSTYGIDVAINDVQTDLYASLTSLWSGDIEGYGRIHKNNKKDTTIPEHYIGENQYKDVYYDDKLGADFFFIVGDDDTTEDEMLYISKVKCVFMLNLSRIYPSDAERSDVKAQRDVVEILRKYDYHGYTITGISKTISNIFSGFDTSKIKFTDIHPAHCFSINIDLSYYLTDKCE